MRGVLGLVLGMVLALSGSAGALARPDARPADNRTTAARADERLRKPMVFRLGRHAGSPACGIACAEFIVAEGEIRRDSVEALAILANRLKRPLPVYFNSPGGSLDGGLALGRALRHYRLDARVARLEPALCVGPTCTESDQRHGVVVYGGPLHPGMCNSACVYSFLGGPQRSLAARSSLGIHRFYLASANDPKRQPLTRLSKADTARLDRSVKDLAYYLVEMGISSELLSMASAVDPSRIRYLTAEDMAALGITTPVSAPEDQPLPRHTSRIGDTSPEITHGWPIVERNGRPFVVKALPVESRRFGGITSEVAIGCPRDGVMYDASIRELVAGQPARHQDARLKLGASAPATTGALSRETVSGAEKSGVLSVDVVSTATAGYPLRLEFPAQGLTLAIAELDRACARIRPQASLGGVGLVPLQRP